MAKNRGWWTLNLKGNTYEELTECDLNHIAKCIKEGCTNGEIVEN